jgi:hypothetical protein
MLHDGVGILLDVFGTEGRESAPARALVVDWRVLREGGMNEEDLSRLLEAGFREFQLARTGPNDGQRILPGVEEVASHFDARLMLTATVMERVRRLLTAPTGQPGGRASLEATGTVAVCKPQWEEETGKLWWGGKVLKCFRFDAIGPQRALAEFEAGGWCAQIHKPPPLGRGNRKKQTQKVVGQLNHKLPSRTLRFHAVGWDIRWEAIM